MRGGSLCLFCVTLGRFHPLAGSDGPAPIGFPVSLPQCLEPRPDGLKPSVDLPPTAWWWPGLAIHAY
jgi:hypothetical protein